MSHIDPNKSDDPVEFAKIFADQAKTEGFHFDFTIHSLETEIDRYLEKYENAERSVKRTIEELLTAYIGETIRSHYNGNWLGRYYGPQNRNGDNFYSCLIEIGKFRFAPGRFISYYLSNGKASHGTYKDALHGSEGLFSRIEKEK